MLVLILGLASSADANDIQVISEGKIQSLEADYQSAASPSVNQLRKPWNCNLFGVRSRMQVQKHDKYYDFTGDNSVVKNGGLAPMRQFNMTSNEWSASNGRWTERLRITSDGTLVSQLSAADDGRVLAYVHCQSGKGKL